MYKVLDGIPFRSSDAISRHQEFLTGKKIIVIHVLTHFDFSEPILFVFRIWDAVSGSEIKKLEFPGIPSSLELSKDGRVLVITHGNCTSFWNADRYKTILVDVRKIVGFLCTVDSLFYLSNLS